MTPLDDLREAARRAVFAEGDEGVRMSDHLAASFDHEDADVRLAMIRRALSWATAPGTAERVTRVALCRLYVAEAEAAP